jgi:hypothetical protein
VVIYLGNVEADHIKEQLMNKNGTNFNYIFLTFQKITYYSIQIIYIWITDPQSSDPEYLKNAKSEHLIG